MPRHKTAPDKLRSARLAVQILPTERALYDQAFEATRTEPGGPVDLSDWARRILNAAARGQLAARKSTPPQDQ